MQTRARLGKEAALPPHGRGDHVPVVQHTVRDYDDWKPVFDAGEAVRTRHGCTGHAIYRGGDDANDLTIMLDFPSRKAA